MRKTPSPKTPAPKAPAAAPVLTLFDAPPQRVPKQAAPKSAVPTKPILAPKPTSAPKAVRAAAKTAPAVKVPLAPKPSAIKTAPPKAAKKIPVQATPSKPTPVRIVAETAATYFTGEGGRAWRMSGKHAVAYVRNAALAGELLATEPRHLAKAAIAVYYDRKGKPFAWQFRFDTTRWEEVVGRLA